MRPRLLLVLICFLFISDIHAQSRTRDFHLSVPEHKIENSLYNHVRFLDSRPDTISMGMVQEGVFNKQVMVSSKVPFGDQLQLLVDSLIDNTANDGELLFQANHLRFAEMTGPNKERGYCYLRATLYTRSGDRYRYLNHIDTILRVKSLDVTRSLLKKSAKAVSDFISSSLQMTPGDTVSYSLNELRNITDIEKKKSKLYTTRRYVNGIYFSFESFKNQMPDMQAMVEMDDKRIHAVWQVGGNGKSEKLNPKKIYAIVYEGQPFIATEQGYYQIRKRKNDFFFIGKAKLGATSAEVLAVGFLYGVADMQMIPGMTSTYEMKIDHYNGTFIPVRSMGYKLE